MSSTVVALIGIVGTIAVAAIGYFVAKLTNSGRVDTTTAAQLWAESTAMRQELRDQVQTLVAEVARLVGEAVKLQERLTTAEHLIDELREQVKTLGGVK
jgi:peptidoglycan hydrolase CwlO-like protein